MYYNSFNNYLKARFGCRVHRVSLNAGFNCPNLDGSLSQVGCIFCDNLSFSHYAHKPQIPLKEQIVSSIKHCTKRFKADKFIAYFQSFSSTYGDIEFLANQLKIIEEFGNIVGIAVSTRPDCIDEEKLDLLESYSSKYEVYIEYGLQSVHDKTLKLINRNHSFSDFKKAVELTAKRKINIAAHVILGLPNETREEMLETARVLASMPLWGIKFHALHVVKQTELEKIYQGGNLKLLDEDEYINLLIDFLELTPESRVILRLVSDSNPKILIAPLWINSKKKVISKIEEEFKRRNTKQGNYVPNTF